MEQFLIYFIVKFIDPIGVIAIFIAVATLRTLRSVLIVAVVVALVSETVSTSLNYTLSWGVAVVPGLLASTTQAALFSWLARRFKKARTSVPLERPKGCAVEEAISSAAPIVRSNEVHKSSDVNDYSFRPDEQTLRADLDEFFVKSRKEHLEDWEDLQACWQDESFRASFEHSSDSSEYYDDGFSEEDYADYLRTQREEREAREREDNEIFATYDVLDMARRNEDE